MALECAGQVATEDVWGRVLGKRGGAVSRAENAVEALALGGRSAWTGTGGELRTQSDEKTSDPFGGKPYHG